MIEIRTDCNEFVPKTFPNSCGYCQTDGHYLCAGCEHIADFDEMEESDNRMRYYPDQEKERIELESWIDVNRRLPPHDGPIMAWDEDSLTNEKKLMFKGGRFLYEAHGVALDYTDTVTKWKPVQETRPAQKELKMSKIEALLNLTEGDPKKIVEIISKLSQQVLKELIQELKELSKR